MLNNLLLALGINCVLEIRKSFSKDNIEYRLLHDTCSTALLLGKLVYFVKFFFGWQLSAVDYRIVVASFFTKLFQFALWDSSTPVTWMCLGASLFVCFFKNPSFHYWYGLVFIFTIFFSKLLGWQTTIAQTKQILIAFSFLFPNSLHRFNGYINNSITIHL